MSDDIIHASDCALHNAPALPPGPCDCGAGNKDRGMSEDIWNDGGEFNDLLQKHVRQAISEFIAEGFFAINHETLTLTFYAWETIEKKQIGLAELLEGELENHVPGGRATNLLTFEFDEPSVLKLQQCLRILRA